ncbi:hypothetical protein niasHS_013473 [Heterodera schachtii]|uniref:RRM domain-containing protein n=1 Tax=Heterodera schachtii TaxID=97005 RepID=A0ABD2ICD2_HETSC
MKRPKRDNSRTKSASVVDSFSFNGQRLSCSNSSSSPPPFHSDEAANDRQHRRASAQHQKKIANNGTADVMKKMPKMNGTTSRGWTRETDSRSNDNNNNEDDETDNGTTTEEQQTGTGTYTGMRDSATSSSSACSASSTLRRPFDHPTNLFLCQQALNSSNNLTLNGMPTTNNELLFPSATTPLLHQYGTTAQLGTAQFGISAQLGSVPLSYGPFGLPKITAGIPAASAVHQQSFLPFHHPAQHLMEAQQQQPLLHPPLVFGHGMNGVDLMSIPPQNAFEGLPIFVLPHAGTLPLNALKRAAEFKAMALNALLLQQQQGAKLDTSRHFHIFVGDLSQEVDNQMLLEACQKFGTVSEAKVMRDPQSSKSRSFGFVAFPNKEDAQRAIEGLNGTILGRRPLRTGWAVRRNSVGNGGGGQTYGSEDEKGDQQPTQKASVTFESVYNSTEADNTTVYLGGLPIAVTEEPIRSVFSQFGTIKEIRLFASQNFGFVVFADKSSAARAIFEMNGRELDLGVVAGKCTVRVKWGRQPQQQNGSGSGGGTGGRAGDAWPTAGTANNGTVQTNGANTIPATLMEFGQQNALSEAAVRMVQQQQQQMAVLSALAVHQQLQHQHQMLRLPNGFQSPLMAQQTQSIANGTTGPMAPIGGWGNE